MILPGASRIEAFEVVERIRRSVAALPDRRPGRASRSRPASPATRTTAQTKDELVAAADQSLYLAEAVVVARSRTPMPPAATRTSSALDETAIALMNRHDPEDLLETIIARAAALLGTPHGFIYLARARRRRRSSSGTGSACSRTSSATGCRSTAASAASSAARAGRSRSTTTTRSPSRSTDLPTSVFGAVVGVPLTSGGRVVGVIGLASGIASSGRSAAARSGR